MDTKNETELKTQSVYDARNANQAHKVMAQIFLCYEPVMCVGLTYPNIPLGVMEGLRRNGI